MRIAPLGAVVAAAVIAVAPSAAARQVAPAPKLRTIRLNWVEQRSASFFHIPMTFKIKDVTIARKAWSVRASFTNRSKKTIRISGEVDPQNMWRSTDNPKFGLGVPTLMTDGGYMRSILKPMEATYARPKLPQLVSPGRTWSGVFGGPGLPLKGKLIYVTFGVFSAQGEQNWSWVSEHAFRL